MLDRTTKSVAARIDHRYVRRPHVLRWGRAIVSGAFVVGALAWVAVSASRNGDRVHNPGPVASAHAMWEHDCRSCHAGAGDGGFSKAVTDEACLKCHKAAAHHPNQRTFVSSNRASAADCTECHVEHERDFALIPSADGTCIRCHADLTTQTASGSPAVQSTIRSFATADGSGPGPHPTFGRQLHQDGRLRDPTRLKFNHKVHLAMREIKQDCSACHSTGPASRDSNTAAPPFRTAKDRPPTWAGSDEHRYMQPISFARHCAQCHEHQMEKLGSQQFAHAPLDVIRSQIRGLTEADFGDLAPRSPPPVPGRPGRRAAAVEPYRSATDAMLAVVTVKLGALEEGPDKTAALNVLEALKPMLAAATPTATTAPAATASGWIPDPRLTEFYIGYVARARCIYCHEVQSGLSAAAATRAVPASDVQPLREILSTSSTGIPDSPRRWYVNSRFDHEAHRQHMSCRDCHGGALTSQSTADLLLPDIANCVRCHKHDTGAVRGAGAACVTCHTYHDRSLRLHVPITADAVVE